VENGGVRGEKAGICRVGTKNQERRRPLFACKCPVLRQNRQISAPATRIRSKTFISPNPKGRLHGVCIHDAVIDNPMIEIVIKLLNLVFFLLTQLKDMYCMPLSQRSTVRAELRCRRILNHLSIHSP
jgi:hypothetical protein